MSSVIATEFHTIPVSIENDDLIAVDKPEKLASIPERNREKISLLKILTEARQQKFYRRPPPGQTGERGHPVREKRRNPPPSEPSSLNSARCTRPTWPVVHGAVEGKRGVIDNATAALRFWQDGGGPGEEAKPCLTEFTVEERFPGYTLVTSLPADRPQAPDPRPFLQHRPSDRRGHLIRRQVRFKNNILALMLHALNPFGFACFPKRRF
ncbi:MAG: hypothetical protein MZV70_54770 [Desulfobacterales bacterium]|nr:hypothetical protein [Desulfobacterales bacterium]